MLLHDCFITLPVNLQAVGILPSDVKCTSLIVCCKCISIMADSDKTLHGDSIRSSTERNPHVSSIIPTASGILHPDSQIHQNAAPASEFLAHKKKPTSFQITSVTVRGSRSNDGGDDSADDLDESHTEDVSSDILDCSRTTDIDNDQLSEDNSNANNDDLPTPSGPSIPVKSVESDSTTSVAISVDVPLNVTVSVSTAPLNDVESNVVTTSADSSNASTVVSTNEPIMNPLPDQWQHRFKVVKIVSSEPFRRGRWLCMDFMDPPTVQSAEVKQEILDSTGGTVLTNVDSTAGSVLSDNPPVNRLAHIYEIPPNQSYPGSISVTVGPHQVQQPLYGIILPMNNGQTPQITMVQTVGIQTSQPEPSQTQESIATPQTSQQQQPPTNFVGQVSQQQPTFSGQPPTYGGQAVQQQNFTSQPQQHQGIPSVPVQSQQLPVQQPQVIPVSAQHQPQITGVSTATAQVISAAVSQHPQVTAPIVSQQQVVQDPLITVHQHSQATQQQNKGLQVHQTPIQLSQQSHPSGQVASVVNSPPLSQLPQVASNVPQTQPSQLHQASGMPGNQPPSITSQVSVASNIPESSLVTSNQSVINQDVFNVPSQVTTNNPETSGLRMPSTANPQALLEVLPETLNSKNVVNGEESESASGGTSTVAIDNKIEQAMDLVKSHLMFAVREEVDVLKEKITELMDRISQLEYENGFLRANASQETLNQLTQAQQLQQQQQQPQTTTITATPLQQQQQLQQQPQIVNMSQQQNIQKQQPAS